MPGTSYSTVASLTQEPVRGTTQTVLGLAKKWRFDILWPQPAPPLWDSLEELSSLWRESAGFQPDYPQEKREKDLARWHEGVQRSMGWAKTDG